MKVNVRQALLEISQSIGRELRDPGTLSYPHALELLGEVEDKLSALAAVVEYCDCPKLSAGLSGRPLGFLPSRHPRALRTAQTDDFAGEV